MPPVATDHAVSIRAFALEVSNLSAAGVPTTGTSGSVWISNQMIMVRFTPVYESGDEVAQKAADGSLCAVFKSPDIFKYVNIHIELCNPEPELIALLAGGSTLTPPPGTGAVTGYASQASGAITVPNGVGLRVWSGAYTNGRLAAVNPYWQWVFPSCQLVLNGDRTLENGLLATVIEGFGFGNSGFGGGGATPLWPFATDKPYQYARGATLPTVGNGFVS